MTSQELNKQFIQKAEEAIAVAWNDGLGGDVIASDLRALASKVAHEWSEELQEREFMKKLSKEGYAQPANAKEG